MVPLQIWLAYSLAIFLPASLFVRIAARRLEGTLTGPPAIPGNGFVFRAIRETILFRPIQEIRRSGQFG
jgi:hypothetical protein